MMAGYGRERAEDYIGCKISLISNADIRYEGTLSAISQQDSTVSLENVRSYGTENRRPGAFIPPQDNVYEYIIFRGADIKDLVVYELPVVSALRSSVDSDPAVLEIAALAGQNEVSNSGPSQGSGSQNMNGKPVSVQNLMNSQQSGQQRGGGQQRYFPGGNRGGNSNGSSIVYSSRGGNWNRGYNRGGYTGGQGYRQGFNNGMQNRSRFDIEEARKADFDVEAANEEFRKMEISKGDETDNSMTQSGNKSEGGSQQTEAKTGYNPDQFFDNISCDAIEKEQQNKQREQMNNLGMNNQWQDLRQKERQHNAETFGITSRTFNRGGRGGRGGFRGGYQSQNQNGGGWGNNGGNQGGQNGGGGWGNNGGNQGGQNGGGGWGNNGGQNQNGGGWGSSGGMNRGGRGGQRGYNGGGGGGGMGRGMGRQQQNQGNGRGNGSRANGGGSGNQSGGSNQQQAKQITLYLQADGKTYAAAQPGNGGGAGRNGGGGGGGNNNGGNGAGGARRSRNRRNRNRNGKATVGNAAGGAGQNQSVLLVASKA